MFAAALLAALWIAGSPNPVPDLRLSAPVVARPGSTIGLRAWRFAEDDDGRAVVLAPDVRVELRNEVGLLLSDATLRPSRVHGLEGRLAIPVEAEGELSLVARAPIDGDQVTVRRSLFVREGIESKRPTGRTVNEFQVYSLGPLRADPPEHAPEALDPRVEEGACVPELPCSVLVWVPGFEGRVRVRPLASLRVPKGPVPIVDQFARARVTVVGAEGRATVDAIDEDGVVRATRDVRLPVVPGAMVLRGATEGSRLRLTWSSLRGTHPVLVDVFDGGRWIDAQSVSPDDPDLRLPGPGVWRVQARFDLFSDNTAGVVQAVVPGPGGSSPALLAAEAVLERSDRDGLDPLAMRVADDPSAAWGDDAVGALLAISSFDVVSAGTGVSATVGRDEAEASAQEGRRWCVALAILMLGLMVSVALHRMETRAQTGARAVLESLDTSEVAPRASVFGRGLPVFVLLVFALMAVIALSKRWF